MPVETFGYPDSLNASNPPTSDGLVGGDDHIRGIKATLKNTFPNITGAITATQTDINTLVNGVGIVNDAGVFFKTSGDGFVNALAGDIDVHLQGVVAATFQRTGGANFLKVKGSLTTDAGITATGPIVGPGMYPIGGVMIWPSDTLPPTTEGIWAWCNGAAYSRTTYATCYGRIGTVHGVGNGVDTFNVPDYQEVVLVGKSGMGGASAPGLLASIASGLKTVLNGIFGSDTVTLDTSMMPSHYHAAGIFDPTHVHSEGGAVTRNSFGGTNSASQVSWSGGANNTGSAATGVRVNSSNGLDTTYSAGGSQAHANLGPRRVTNYAIRLA